MIVKTDAYTREQIGKVVQMRANVEGLKMSPEVVDKVAGEGEKSSLRSVIFTESISCSFMLMSTSNQICSTASCTCIHPGNPGWAEAN